MSRVRRWRETFGWTQARAAAELGMSPKTLWRLEQLTDEELRDGHRTALLAMAYLSTFHLELSAIDFDLLRLGGVKRIAEAYAKVH